MKIHELKPAPGSKQPRKRVGRGIAAGQGKTSGRGQKGQGSRSSSGLPRSFEGGQMPLAQRLPKLRGFTNINRKEYAVVNLGKLNRFEKDTEVNPQLLQEVGLVRKPLDGIKILAAGELKVALKVSAHRVSAGARKAIEALGGTVELLGPQTEDKPEKRAKKNARARATAATAAARAGSAPADAPAAAEPAQESPSAPAPAAEAAASEGETATPDEDHTNPSDAPRGE